MKFLLPNYSCLQNPWLRGYRPQIPVLSVLNWICWTPPPTEKKFLGTPLFSTIRTQVRGNCALCLQRTVQYSSTFRSPVWSICCCILWPPQMTALLPFHFSPSPAASSCMSVPCDGEVATRWRDVTWSAFGDYLFSLWGQNVFFISFHLFLFLFTYWNLLLPTDAHNVKKHRVIKTF